MKTNVYDVDIVDVTHQYGETSSRFVRTERVMAESRDKAVRKVMKNNGWTKSNLFCPWGQGAWRRTDLKARMVTA